MLKYVLFILISFTLATSQGAELCQSEGPETSVSSQMTETVNDFALSSQSLYDGLFHYTDKLDRPLDKIKALHRKAQAAHSEILKLQNPTALSNYFLGLKLLGASEAFVLGSTTAFDEKYQLLLDTQNYLSLSASFDSGVPGVDGIMDGDKLKLRLNYESQFQAHLDATARVQKVDQAQQYFQASKCMLSRLLIEKANGYAALTYEKAKLELEGFKACNGFELKNLLNNSNTQFVDQYYLGFQNLLGRSVDLMSPELIELFKNSVAAYQTNPMALMMNTAMDLDPSSTDLIQLDNGLSEIETQLLQTNPWLGELIAVSSSLEGSLKSHLGHCTNQAIQLPNFDKILTRLVMMYGKGSIATSNAIAFTKDPQKFEANLTEGLTAIMMNYIIAAAGMDLNSSGQTSVQSFNAQLKKAMPDLQNELRSQLARSNVAAQLIAALENSPISNQPGIISTYPAFLEAAQELHRITNPATPRSELAFDSGSIAKLFEGGLGALPQPYRFYMEQVLTRKDHAERVLAWIRARAFLEEDQAKYGYECIDTNIWQDTSAFFGALFRKSPNPDLARQKNCHFMMKLSEHLGIDNTQNQAGNSSSMFSNTSSFAEPANFAAVWPSFEKYYDKDDNEVFEKRYREFLKGQYANVYRALDIPMKKLGVDTKDYVYDALVGASTEAEQETLLRKAIVYTRNNLETEVLSVIHAKETKDLHAFISNGMLLNNIYDSRGLNSYLPSEFVFDEELSSSSAPQWASLAQYHIRYQDKLLRTERLNQQLNSNLISSLNLPIIYMGGVWVIRAIALRTPGLKAGGAVLHTMADSSRLITQGYFNSLTWIFAAGFANAYSWHKDVGQRIKRIENMKYSDAIIFDGDLQVVDYDTYLTKHFDLSEEKKDAFWDMVIYGAFSGSSLIMSALEPYWAARAASGSNKSLEKINATRMNDSSRFMMGWLKRGIRNDKVRLKPYLNKLGVSGYDINALRAARSKSPNAYREIIWRLGQRIQKNLGRLDKEKLMAKELFGTESATLQLRAFSSEFAKLFPNLTKGGF